MFVYGLLAAWLVSFVALNALYGLFVEACNRRIRGVCCIWVVVVLHEILYLALRY